MSTKTRSEVRFIIVPPHFLSSALTSAKHSPTKHHPSLRQPSANALDERRILPDGSGRGTVLARALLLQLPKERARYPSSNLVSFSSLFTLLVLFQQIVSHSTCIPLVLYTSIGNATRQRTAETRLETAATTPLQGSIIAEITWRKQQSLAACWRR